jgi:hypothetical protein
MGGCPKGGKEDIMAEEYKLIALPICCPILQK